MDTLHACVSVQLHCARHPATTNVPYGRTALRKGSMSEHFSGCGGRMGSTMAGNRSAMLPLKDVGTWHTSRSLEELYDNVYILLSNEAQCPHDMSRERSDMKVTVVRLACVCTWPCAPASAPSGMPFHSSAQSYTRCNPSVCCSPRPPVVPP
jgi:hypothetical protein